MDKNEENKIKVVLVGDPCTEKTRILSVFNTQESLLTEEEEEEEERKRKEQEEKEKEKEEKKNKDNILNKNENKENNKNNENIDNEQKNITTPGSSFVMRSLYFEDNITLKFECWDSPGQKKYRGMKTSFYKGAKAFVVLYDITRKDSFEEIKNYWIKEIKPFCSSETIIAIVGNKSHLYEREEVYENDAKEYAKSINALFRLVSTRDVSSVNDLFYEVGKRYIKKKGLSTVTKKKEKQQKKIQIQSSKKIFRLLKYQKF